MKYTEEQMQKMREVKILTLLNQTDTGRKTAVCCPYHNEKTPSLYIYPDNSYHCYGCSANGQNAIDFISNLEGVDFKEALLELSKYI